MAQAIQLGTGSAARRRLRLLRGPSTRPEMRAFRRFKFVTPLANICGAIDLFAFLFFVLPLPSVPHLERVRETNAAVFAAYMLLSFIVATLWGNARAEPIVRWLDSDQEADERELMLVLRHPMRQLTVNAVMWLGGLIVFGALNATYSLSLAALVVVATVLAGATTCAVAYLLAERLLRPVTARALASCAPPRPAVPGVAARVLLAWLFTTAVPLIAGAAVAASVFAGAHVSATRLAATGLVLSLAAVVLGVLAMTQVARSVAEPLQSLRLALRRVERGDLAVDLAVDDGSEVGFVEAGFNQMVTGLRERATLRDLFGRHVGEDVARHALERGVSLGGETREAAVLFVDIIGSTALAADRAPEEVVSLLNEFYAVMIDVVSGHGGHVNKFAGDGALCVFGAPVALDDASGCALQAARELGIRLRARVPQIDAAIGVSAGAVLAGNVGTAERLEYTVIGDAVNEAARLVELAKRAPQRVVASERILLRSNEAEQESWIRGGEVTLRGRTSATGLAWPSEPARTSRL